MQNKLALVIPAFKATYLRKTLSSIAAQTNKNFTLFIGDDASPYNLESIVNEYIDELAISYVRFESNMGSTDLVGQWNRCLKQVDAEWVWLFSDDDMLEENCVEMFYRHLATNPNEELFHLNVTVIDENDNVLFEANPYPAKLSSTNFFQKRINFEISSFAVEYIIKNEVLIKEGYFDSMDLAWGADDAAWVKFSRRKGISTMTGAKVRWRLSKSNISSIIEDKEILIRKMNANVSYLKWAQIYFGANSLKDKTSDFDKFKWYFRIIRESVFISYSEKLSLGYASLRILGYRISYLVRPYLWFYMYKDSILKYLPSYSIEVMKSFYTNASRRS